MTKEKLDKIEKLIDSAYNKISDGISQENYKRMETKVAYGLDELLEIKRVIQERD